MAKKPETRALLILAGLVLAIGVIFYTRIEGWSLVDSIYFCVVTLGTVGYGDITPTTDAGKIFTALYIVFGLGIIGGLFATLGQLMISRIPLEARTVTRAKEQTPAGPASTTD